MISYVRGKLVYKTFDSIIIEAGGIGYNIMISGLDYEKLPTEESEIKIHTYFSVKEDAMQLYGFLDKEAHEMFKLLLTVNGVGPKAGLAILSVLTPDDLRFAILSQDTKAITKAPGVGAKVAQRVLLELKDKVDLEEAFEKKSANVAEAKADKGPRNDAIMALTALGYSATESSKAVSQVEIAEGMSVDEILSKSLKFLL